MIVSRGGDHTLVEWHGNLVGVWDGAVSLASVNIWRQKVSALVAARPGETVYLSYERSGFQMPSDGVRKVITDTLRAIDGNLAACAVVLPGSGFASAAVRALVGGLVMVARPKTPLRCLPTIDAAHSWVVQVAPRATWASASELRAVIAAVEAGVPAAQGST